MSRPVVLIVTIAVIALSAFFVAVEFAFMAARQHRLEERAAASRAARAAVRSSGELTLLLARSQLSEITACCACPRRHHKPGCTTRSPLRWKPWVCRMAAPRSSTSYSRLFIVTFLHLVIA